MMMLRVIVLASALAHGKAAPSTSRNLAGRELGREDCDGNNGNTPGSKQKCYEDVTDEILAKGRFETGSICTRDQSKDFTCTGCLECADPIHDVCEPRANDEHGRVFSSMTTFPYYDRQCTGITTVANSPFGAYAAGNTPAGRIAVTFPKITNLNAVPYILELRNKETTFPDGAFQGNTFKPRGLNNPPPGFYNSLDIQWCPNQNWFQVPIDGVTYTLLSQAGGCCQRSPSDDRVAPWEYLNGVPIVLESKTIGCTRNTWMPDKTYNEATEKCELPAAAEAQGPCCDWCDNKKFEHTAWKSGMADGDPAKCEWNQFCSGCSECDP